MRRKRAASTYDFYYGYVPGKISINAFLTWKVDQLFQHVLVISAHNRSDLDALENLFSH